MAIVACEACASTNAEPKPSGSATATAEKPFDYATLPDQAEWTYSLAAGLLWTERQRIQSTNMPEPVWKAFPLPEFAGQQSRFVPMVRPSYGGSYGYGMDSSRCVVDALIKTNSINARGLGISGGQYAYYQIVKKIEDPLLYDPRNFAFLIRYQEAYLKVTFPNLHQMKVQRLKAPTEFSTGPCSPPISQY